MKIEAYTMIPNGWGKYNKITTKTKEQTNGQNEKGLVGESNSMRLIILLLIYNYRDRYR